LNARTVGLACWIGLVALHVAWPFWSGAPPRAALLAIALMVTPLLLPLISLRGGVWRALLRVGVLCLFYFCHGVVAAWASPASRVPALVEIVLCVVLIGILGRHARRGRAAAAAQLRPDAPRDRS
jgi:uncharacterized membrane protein